MKRKLTTVGAAVACVLVGSACGVGASSGSNFNVEDQEVRIQDAISHNFLNNQPIPLFSYSQLRQNLKEIEKAQAEGVQTTSYFYNMGSNKPIRSCPSIGAPIPVTDSLTNPEQPIRDNSQPLNNGGGNVTLQQMEPTGVYAGASTGTYVMCIQPDGSPRAVYWEGFVETEFGASQIQGEQIQSVGAPSFKFTRSK